MGKVGGFFKSPRWKRIGAQVGKAMGKAGGFLRLPSWKRRVKKVWKGIRKAGGFFKWWKRGSKKDPLLDFPYGDGVYDSWESGSDIEIR